MEKRETYLAAVASAMAGADRNFDPRRVAEKSLLLADELVAITGQQVETIAEIKKNEVHATGELQKYKGKMAALVRFISEKIANTQKLIQEKVKLSEASNDVSLEINIANLKGELTALEYLLKKSQELI